MIRRLLNDADHWRNCAEEARINAEQMHGEEPRLLMLRVAEDYEHLAERAERPAAE